MLGSQTILFGKSLWRDTIEDKIDASLYAETTFASTSQLHTTYPEVHLIVVNGQSVDFSYLVQSGDRIAVYPMFESLTWRLSSGFGLSHCGIQGSFSMCIWANLLPICVCSVSMERMDDESGSIS
jgi:hypothetical protein